MKRRIILSMFFLASTTPLSAATYMEVSNSESGDSHIWINDSYAHFDVVKNAQQTPAEEPGPGEMLIDIKNKKLYAIDHKSKTLVDMSDFSMPGQPHPVPIPVKVAFESQGHGPKVAGFATQQYSVSANGEKCYSALYSKDVIKNKQIVAFYEAMVKSAPSATNHANPCEAADEQIDKIPPEKYGIALKVMDKTGKTIFEVKKIKTGVNPPSHYLQLPAGYKTMSMMQMMQQQMQSDMPPPTK